MYLQDSDMEVLVTTRRDLFENYARGAKRALPHESEHTVDGFKRAGHTLYAKARWADSLPAEAKHLSLRVAVPVFRSHPRLPSPSQHSKIAHGAPR